MTSARETQPEAPRSGHQRDVSEPDEPLQTTRENTSASREELELPDAQRAELDRRIDDYRRDPDSGVSWESLRDSLHRTSQEVDERWAAEASRRLAELRSGEAKAIPGEEVFAQLADALRAKHGHR